jgi:aminoglycoside phosphotransferase (APT) family kinase protein
MQPQPRAYLFSLHREIRALTASLGAAEAAGLNYCIDAIFAQVIARDEAAEALVDAFAGEIAQAARAAGVAMAVPDEGGAIERRAAILAALERCLNETAGRATLVAAAARADHRFLMNFAQRSAEIVKEMNTQPAATGWAVTMERVAAALPQMAPQWAGAEVVRLKPVAGVHAKEIYFLDLRLASGLTEQLVMRCDRAVDLTRASVADEYPLLRALHDRGFAIPEPLAVTKDAGLFEQPVLIMRRVSGAEKKIEAVKAPEILCADAARFLARLHATPIAGTGLAGDAANVSTAQMWRTRIAAQFEWWREMADEPAPVMWRAKDWLEANVEVTADAATVVHGDFSLRNLLLDEDDRISSVLDWELAHVGHPAEDLGYMRLTVETVMPWERFEAMYRAAGGGTVSRRQIAYFDVWGLYRNLAITASARNFFLSGKVSDHFLGTAGITHYPEQLRQLGDALEGAER